MRCMIGEERVSLTIRLLMQKTLSLQSLNLSGYYGLERKAYTAIGARGGYIDG